MVEYITKEEAIDKICSELDSIDHVPQWVFDRLKKALSDIRPSDVLERGTVTHLENYAYDCGMEHGSEICQSRHQNKLTALEHLNNAIKILEDKYCGNNI